ncbi:hypothetical protein BWD162_012210 [Bartonella sp. WD16.2]|nr:hypothetical protein BWD162_012210 [Bartonella sp. WD16.2]
MNQINNNEIHLNNKEKCYTVNLVFATLKKLLILFLLWFRGPLYIIAALLSSPFFIGLIIRPLGGIYSKR